MNQCEDAAEGELCETSIEPSSSLTTAQPTETNDEFSTAEMGVAADNILSTFENDQASDSAVDPSSGSRVLFWVIMITFGTAAIAIVLWYIQRGKRKRPAPLADPNGQTVDLTVCFNKSSESVSESKEADAVQADDVEPTEAKPCGMVFPSQAFLKAVSQRATNQLKLFRLIWQREVRDVNFQFFDKLCPNCQIGCLCDPCSSLVQLFFDDMEK